jgi:hypothetical protein
VGVDALYSNTMGLDNTATGTFALYHNTGVNVTGGPAVVGSYNTATGVFALYNNTTGNANTASGDSALGNNTDGNGNTACGSDSLASNTDGNGNTAGGFSALGSNTTGSSNTAIGIGALDHNTTGGANSALGVNALWSNTVAFGNSAIGPYSLYSNTTGGGNNALGLYALFDNTTGNNNIGLGYYAGHNLTTGDNNIDIGNLGTAAESSTIRIGRQGTQTATYIAGISGSVVTGPDVVVNSSGRLGVVASSARFKRDIRDLGAASSGLMKLRPVTFRYRDDPQGVRQYGLVAEEVERVYPELVTYGADGKVETVRYSMLTAMLLNELQKQSRENQRQAEQIKRLSAQVAELKAIFEQAMAAKNHPRVAAGSSPASSTPLRRAAGRPLRGHFPRWPSVIERENRFVAIR